MTTDPTPSQLVPIGATVTIVVRVDYNSAVDLLAVLCGYDDRQLVIGCTTLAARYGNALDAVVDMQDRIDEAIEVLKGGE